MKNETREIFKILVLQKLREVGVGLTYLSGGYAVCFVIASLLCWRWGCEPNMAEEFFFFPLFVFAGGMMTIGISYAVHTWVKDNWQKARKGYHARIKVEENPGQESVK